MSPIFVDEIIRDCVSKVSDIVTPQLNGYTEGVFFRHGHIQEIVDELQLLSQGTTTQRKRYPLVALLRDFPEIEEPQPGVYSKATLNIIIATKTEPTYNSDKRKEVSFKPVLYPIYEELKRQMYFSGKFLSSGSAFKGCTRIDHYFWGRQPLYESAKQNVFKDWIDCIEIRNLDLLTINKC